MPGRPVESGSSSEADLEASLKELEQLIELPPKERPDAVTLVDTICSHAENGLSPNIIARLTRVITHQTPLSTPLSNLLVDNLYPSATIPKQTVYSIAANLGTGARKPNPAVQAHLIRWLILVRDAIDDRSALAHIYTVLFNLVGNLAIQPYLLHLLAVTTTHRHVKPFRVDTLLNIQAATGGSPGLTGLLKVYRSFRPDLVPDSAIIGRASPFEHPDPAWKARLDALIGSQEDTASFDDENQFRVLNRSVTRARTAYIPYVHTRKTDQKNEALEDVNGIEDFARKFNRLQLPVQLASALNDPLMQHYLDIAPTQAASKYFDAVDQEVGRALDAQRELLKLGESLDKGCIEILRSSLTWARRFKSLLPSVSAFCSELLQTSHWHGNADLLIDILAWSNPYDEPNWQSGILSPQDEQAILALSGDGASALLSLYIKMIYNRLPGVSMNGVGQGSFASLSTFCDHVSALALRVAAATHEVSAYMTVAAYLQALADLAIAAPNESYRTAIMSFEKRTVYLLAFSMPSIAILSGLCGAIADHKQTVFALETAKVSPLKPGVTSTLNGFIMDFSNLFWRCRAFCADRKEDSNAHGCMLDRKIAERLHEYAAGIPNVSPPYHSLNLFTFSFHPAFSNIAAATWHELEEKLLESTRMDLDGDDRDIQDVRHRGPVTRNSLGRLSNEGGAQVDWTTFRTNVLHWLRDCGALGVDSLMKSTIKALMPNVLGRQQLNSSQGDTPVQMRTS